jgi:hypothetical protein
MIRYALACDQNHEFESWFSNSAAYDEQAAKGLVACPLCGSTKVEKALMTPRLGRSDSPSRHSSSHQESRQETSDRDSRAEAGGDAGREQHPEHDMPAPQPAETASGAPGRHGSGPAPVAVMTPPEQELRRKLRELRNHLVKNAENVGAKFPEEARKMHYGETDRRSIYGVASAEDAEALHEEGIAFSALPELPDDRN